MPVVELLHSALEAHGVASIIDGGCVRLCDADLALEPRVFDGPDNAQAKIVHLDVVAHSARVAPRCIVESMAGFGPDRSAAEKDAFGKFLLGSFHVLLTALAEHSCESNPAEWLHWQGKDGAWRICDGPLLVHSSGSKRIALLNSWDWSFPEEYRSLRHFFVAVPDAR